VSLAHAARADSVAGGAAGADGSITIYIQADSPGKDKESNWLPSLKEPFYMLLRTYLPMIEVLNGQYEIPGVLMAVCKDKSIMTIEELAVSLQLPQSTLHRLALS